MRQTLLQPIAVEPGKEDAALLLDNLELLEQFGFGCEDFGDGAILVRELERMGVTPEQLTPEKRLQVITALEAGGLFLLKGAVKSAAASLHCSPASVYRYITQIKNSDSGQI